MRKHKKKHSRRTHKCAKGKRGAACRRRRRGLGDYDSANVSVMHERAHRAATSECEQMEAQRAAMGLKPRPCAPAPSPAKVEKSEAKAEKKGCKAPKGKVCVGKDVAKIGTVLRQGCRKARAPGTYVCTEKALAAKAAGKHKKAGHRAPKGYKWVSVKKATYKSGALKQGCRLFHGRTACSKKVA